MIVRAIYKALRSIIFSVTLVVVGLYVLAYVLISIPAFTNHVREIAGRELSKLTGGRVLIGTLDLSPFNEAKIYGIEIYDPDGEKCIEIETLAAGISLWKLVYEQRIVLTYGEIIGLKAKLVQPEKDTPLNIDFIIKAFASKDDKKEKKHFELALRNVVLRKSSIEFLRPWEYGKTLGKLDLWDLKVEDLAADISFPKISDNGVEVDLRRLSMSIVNAIDIQKIGLKGSFETSGIQVKNFELLLPSSRFYIPEFILNPDDNESFTDVLKKGSHNIEISKSYITPADFSNLYEPLSLFTEPLNLSLDATGNLNEITIEQFNFGNPDLLSLSFSGGMESFSDINNSSGDLSDFKLYVSSTVFQRIETSIKRLQPVLKNILKNIGNLQITGDFAGAMANKSLKGHLEIDSRLLALTFEGGIQQNTFKAMEGTGELNISNFKFNELFPKVPVSNLNANLVTEGVFKRGEIEGMLSLVIEDFEYKGIRYDGLSLNIGKEEEFIDGDLLIHNDIADIEAKFGGDIEGEEKSVRLDLDLQKLDLSKIVDLKTYKDYIITGSLNLDGKASGNDVFDGEFALNKFSFTSPDGKKSLHLKQLLLTAEVVDSIHSLNLKSDWIDLRAEGPYQIKEIPKQLQALFHNIFPVLLPEHSSSMHERYTSSMDFDIVIKKNNSLTEFFNLPVRLLVPVTIAGTIQGPENTASLTLDLPYLQQGRDKLIYDTKLLLELDGHSGVLNSLVQTTVPVKKGDLALNINFFGKDDLLNTDLHWINTENSDFRGHLVIDTEFSKNEFSRIPDINVVLQPSILQMGTADWNINKSKISYNGESIKIDGLKLWHEDQFVEIDGIASKEYDDEVRVDLAEIDVDYIFDMLQINYVTFGGTATGQITGHSLLSGDPVAETESLNIKDFTYNGASLGECIASSRWNNEEKEIEISADIITEGKKSVTASGGIWLGRDSLSFNIEADKVPVDFVQPFMAVFSSHVGGYATGDVHLFGTFRDIDMTGRIFADSVAVKLDYTNTVYHGSDSVILNPGKIEIPHFLLYDKYGKTAMLTGELTHRYFHDPSFTFRLSEANDFLCYDTNQDLNPDWFGTLFGNGSALLTGVPGLVDISADMTVSGNSTFTFVLSDTQYARDYQFLTFSDRRAEEAKKNQELTARDIKEMLKNKLKQDEGSLSRFGIDIRASVTPQVLFTLIMDPVAGDKITARGRGAMQVKYESDEDEMTMYGKYELEEGNYNFSLQDIILRDFKIKEGSSISFNGNPLQANLDISATYRVNTNLSDLDKSFSTDRDLNRTNVPVDAVLTVTGNMTSPDITFDIELPTLTQDVERKVKSIISTDDMMNRQIIYLLALNRFYTPEYMGNSGNGGELAGFASSTISSQLSNILGQLTDKFSVSPSFRSDKGDFSDIEVDVALSSKLLNNRLLINGNFGYRDRSNSSTTFVGDFDVEYLLSKNGNLRLKAYNHFNDQNYYLREALTTQGLGVVYRRDFDDWFTFLKKNKNKEEKNTVIKEEERDSEK